MPDYENLSKTWLPDEEQHEIVYAMEYSMLAILDRLPPPMPLPETWSDISRRLMNGETKNLPPIPVPRDWKPSLKLPRKMLETQSISELEDQTSRLQRLVSNALVGHNGNGYLETAYTYITRALMYAIRARFKNHMTRMKRVSAMLKRTDDRFDASYERTTAEKEPKAGAQQPKPGMEK